MLRRPVLALLGVGLAAVMVAVLAVSLHHEEAAAADVDVVLAEQDGGEPTTQESPAALAKLGSPPTGSFSRRRATIAPQDNLGKKFDDMFSKYYQDPQVDLGGMLNKTEQADEATKPANSAPETSTVKKTVEVVKELQPMHTIPVPDPQNPPEVAVIDGKDYQVSKVVKVQQDVHTSPTVSGAEQPEQPSFGPLTANPGAPAESSPSEAVSPGQPADDTGSSDASAMAAAQAASQASAQATAQATAAAAAPQVMPSPALQPPSHPMEANHVATSPGEPAGQSLVLPPLVNPAVEPPLSPPLADPLVDPTIVPEPRVKQAPHEHISIRPPTPETSAQPAPAPAPAAAATGVDDAQFGLPKDVPKAGVWKDGNSDFSLDAPWDQDEDPGHFGGGKSEAPVAANAIEVSTTLEAHSKAEGRDGDDDDGLEDDDGLHEDKTPKSLDEPSKKELMDLEQLAASADSSIHAEDESDDDVPPWADEAAPFEAPKPTKTKKLKQPSAKKPDVKALLQMAARSCAARKVKQKKHCAEAKAKAVKTCHSANGDGCKAKQDAAKVLCDQGAKATFKACFKDWQTAKQLA